LLEQQRFRVSSTARANRMASCRDQAPLASARMVSPGLRTAAIAAIRSASRAAVSPILSLEDADALRPLAGHEPRHVLGRAERDRDVDREVRSSPSAEERGDGPPNGPTEGIPNRRQSIALFA
jgi:hypothetical protein